MWCRTCQQDVPAVAASGDASQVCCARCGIVHQPRDAESKTSAPGDEVSAHLPPGGKLNHWQLDHELAEAQRLVQQIKNRAENNGSNTDGQSVRGSRIGSHQKINSETPTPSRSTGSAFSWLVTGVGLAGLVCGCTLLVWSMVGDRAELWTVGLAIALVSQVVLLCGVLLRRDDAPPAERQGESPAATTFVQVQSGPGNLHPSGLTVHFGNPPTGAAENRCQPFDAQTLRHEIERVATRRAA